MRLAACLLLAACAHRGPARTDTSETGDTGVVAGPCGTWAGVVDVGTRWKYEPTDAYRAAWGFDGTYTIEVAALDGDTVTLAEAGDYSGEAGSFTWTRTDTWRCDAAGAWWTRSEAATSGTSHGDPIASEGWRTFEPGWLVRPATLDATWSDTFTATLSANGGEPTETAASCVTSVAAEGTRAVGDRTVAVRQVVPECTGVGADPVWLGEGVGLVETDDERLITYAP